MRRLFLLALLLALAVPAKSQVSGSTVGHENDVISCLAKSDGIDCTDQHGKNRFKLFFRSIGHSFTDGCKTRFWKECLPRYVSLAWNFADMGSTIKGRSLGMPEVGPAKYFVGRYPSTAALISLTTVVSVSEVWGVHFLDNEFGKSCETDKRWDSIDAHTHDRKSCYGWLTLADSIAKSAKEQAILRNNVNWIRRNER